MHDHGGQIGKAQDKQEGHLVERIAKHLDRIALRTDGIVDDPLGQFERGIKERKGKKREGEQPDLLAARELPDEGKDGLFQRVSFAGGLKVGAGLKVGRRARNYNGAPSQV